MIRCVGRCLGLAVWTASSESRMCLVPVHERQRRVGKSRLLTAPPWSPAGGHRVQSSVCGRRAQGLAGRTRRPGVVVAEGSGSSERRRRRVVAAVAARATCIDGLLTGRGAPMRRLPVDNPSVLGILLAPAEGLPPSTADIAGFVHGIRILLFARVGVYDDDDLSMVPRLRRGRLAGRALSHPFILRGQNRQERKKQKIGACGGPSGTPSPPRMDTL